MERRPTDSSWQRVTSPERIIRRTIVSSGFVFCRTLHCAWHGSFLSDRRPNTDVNCCKSRDRIFGAGYQRATPWPDLVPVMCGARADVKRPNTTWPVSRSVPHGSGRTERRVEVSPMAERWSSLCCLTRHLQTEGSGWKTMLPLERSWWPTPHCAYHLLDQWTPGEDSIVLCTDSQ